MFSYDWILPQNLPLCLYSDRFFRTARDCSFRRLSDATSPEQFEQAQANLLQMKQDLEKDMPPVHYAAQFGTHICVQELYLEAAMRLKNLSLLHPDQPTTPEPPEPLDPEEVFNNLGSDGEPETDDTYLGTDTNSENIGSNT
jgi:hypothetical protein